MYNPATPIEALRDIAAAVKALLIEHADVVNFDPGTGSDGNPLVHVTTDTPGGGAICDRVDVWPSRLIPTIAANVQAGTERSCAVLTAVEFNVRVCVCYDLDVDEPSATDAEALTDRFTRILWVIWSGLIAAANRDGGLITGVSCQDVTFADAVDLGPREAGTICGTMTFQARLKPERQ